MEKLIITCCVTDPQGAMKLKGVHMPVTPREIADSAREACDAGASVVHVHQPLVEGAKIPPAWNDEAWLEVAQLIHQESDVIFQHGQGGMPFIRGARMFPEPTPEFLKLIESRKDLYDAALKKEKPEMITVVPCAIDFALAGHFMGGVYLMVTREALEASMHVCREHGVKPEFEVWHNGASWNINYLAKKGLLDPPYWCTLAFGVPGGAWSSPSLDELLHRIKYLPENSLWEIAAKCGEDWGVTTQQQLDLCVYAITLGGHVRVGLEDNPYYTEGVPAESNAQIVERVVRMARELGREIATPAEARQILRLPPRK